MIPVYISVDSLFGALDCVNCGLKCYAFCSGYGAVINLCHRYNTSCCPMPPVPYHLSCGCDKLHTLYQQTSLSPIVVMYEDRFKWHCQNSYKYIIHALDMVCVVISYQPEITPLFQSSFSTQNADLMCFKMVWSGTMVFSLGGY